MATYYLTAKRETIYNFDIVADSEEEAIAEMTRIELEEDVEEYANDWYPLEVVEVEELEEDN